MGCDVYITLALGITFTFEEFKSKFSNEKDFKKFLKKHDGKGDFFVDEDARLVIFYEYVGGCCRRTYYMGYAINNTRHIKDQDYEEGFEKVKNIIKKYVEEYIKVPFENFSDIITLDRYGMRIISTVET